MHTLKKVQTLPISIEKAWNFFSSPANLKEITPSHMGFHITSGYQGEKMYSGMIISYKVKPLLNIPLNWVTEITHVQEPYYFVDEQRFGPYTFWHHKHFLKEVATGVEMTDLVHYKIPMSLFGNIINSIYVRGRLNAIFSYRYQKLTELFPPQK